MEICRALIEHGAKVNRIDSFSMSALHWSSTLNLADITACLVGFNADQEIVDLKNETPLDKAINLGHLRIVEILLAQLDFSKEQCANYRRYMCRAIQLNNSQIFGVLFDRLLKNGEEYFERIGLNSIDESVGSLLHYAVILSSIDEKLRRTVQSSSVSSHHTNTFITKKLLESGVEVSDVRLLRE